MNDSIKAVCFPPAVLSTCSFDRKLMPGIDETIEKNAGKRYVRYIGVI